MTADAWVFFDVGNVLFDDQGQSCEAYRHAWRALSAADPALTVAALFAEREALAAAGTEWILATILKRRWGEAPAAAFLKDLGRRLAADYDRWHLPAPGLTETLDDLARDRRLAVVANQPPECLASLRRRGLDGRFAVLGISDLVGLHKPDVAFYQWALAAAGAAPERCVMVGDRLDNDIAPAAAAGLRTVWLRWADGARAWEPEDDFARAYADSVARQPLYGRRGLAANPDAVVPDLRSVPAAVRQLSFPVR